MSDESHGGWTGSCARHPRDSWDELWESQREQQEALNLDPTKMDQAEKARVAKDLALGLSEEASKFTQHATRYKRHILSPPIEKSNIVEAGVDVLKYTIALLQLHGVSCEDALAAFEEKTGVVQHKYECQALDLQRTTKLIISDLDHCIMDLSAFHEEVEALKDGREVNGEVTLELEAHKEDFYRSGGFRNLPAVPGARLALTQMKESGFKIAIITARPHHQYSRIYADTISSLKKEGIDHDLLLFSKDKAEAIYEHILPARPRFFIEDRSKHALELTAIGVHVLLMDKPWNRDLPENPLIQRVSGWDEIREIVFNSTGETGSGNK